MYSRFIVGSDLSFPWLMRKAKNKLTCSVCGLLSIGFLLLFLLIFPALVLFVPKNLFDLIFFTVICMFELFLKLGSIRIHCIFIQSSSSRSVGAA